MFVHLFLDHVSELSLLSDVNLKPGLGGYRPVIPATREADAWESHVEGQPGHLS